MLDRFADRSLNTNGPAFGGFAVTPSDTLDLPEVTRALYVGTAGSLRVIMAAGVELTFAGVAAGTTLLVRVQRVLATGSSAGAILGLV